MSQIMKHLSCLITHSHVYISFIKLSSNPHIYNQNFVKKKHAIIIFENKKDSDVLFVKIILIRFMYTIFILSTINIINSQMFVPKQLKSRVCLIYKF